MKTQEISTNIKDIVSQQNKQNLKKADALAWIQRNFKPGTKEIIKMIMKIKQNKQKEQSIIVQNQSQEDYLSNYYPKRIYIGKKDHNTKEIDIKNQCQLSQIKPENKKQEVIQLSSVAQQAQQAQQVKLQTQPQSIGKEEISNSKFISIEKSKQDTDKKKAFQNEMFNHHKKIIIILTNERFKYDHIAKHIYRGNLKQESQSQGKGFAFHVQKGIDKWYAQDLDIVLLYLFVRDMSEGIIQLQKAQILHLDMRLRNFLLFRLSKVQDLNSIQKKLNSQKDLVQIIDNITFKVIDFDFAILLRKDCEKQRNCLIQKRQEIEFYFDGDMFASYLEGKKNEDLNELKDSQTIKVSNKPNIHFKECLQSVIKQIKNQKDQKLLDQFKEQGKYFTMVEEKKYEEIIKQMNMKINQWKKNVKKENF